MTTRRLPGVVALSLALGIFAGLLFPGAAKATTVYYSVTVHPGGEYDYLTCGWHDACGSNPSLGNGIDFRNYYPSDSYWRSWTFRSDSSIALNVATGTVATDNGVCQRVKVSVKDNEGVARGSVRYTHQDNAGSNFTLTGKDIGVWSGDTSTRVSSTVEDEPDEDCAFEAPHLHMESVSLFVINNGQNGWPNYVNAQVAEATDSSSMRVFLSSWQYEQ